MVKLTLEGETSEIVEILSKIDVKNETNKEKVVVTYSLSNAPLEFIFDEYRSRV